MHYVTLDLFLQKNIFKPVFHVIPQIFLPPSSCSQTFSACVVITIGQHSGYKTKLHSQKS